VPWLIELDIHFRIEDDLYYPALGAATKLIAVAHAEHRQVIDQLSVRSRNWATRWPPRSSNTAVPLCTSCAPRGAPRWYALYSCGPIDE
jgi:hypothetical protein